MMNPSPPAEPIADTAELDAVLTPLGLAQYAKCLHENGFETWDDVTIITEPDMVELGFRLGDRRKLQRAIREYLGSSALTSGHTTGRKSPVYEDLSDLGEVHESIPGTSTQARRRRRQYRWRPRPDPNAAPKPKTAYVLFGEHVRQDPALSGWTFADLAKETGKRWRELSSEERAGLWELPAAERRREYKEELELYKQTESYKAYEAYLENFKQWQNPAAEDMAFCVDEAGSSRRASGS